MPNEVALAEEVSCPNCGHSCPLLLRARDLNYKTSCEKFAYYRCSGCGLVCLHPLPADLSVHYPSDYAQHAIPQTLDEMEQKAIAEGPRVSFVQQFATTGRLLEVGAGYGTLSYLAKQRGFEVEAVEMDSSCCRHMEKMGIRAICSSSFSEMDKLLGEFDVIVLWHVIEHLENYKESLAVLARHLSPCGFLVICSPNPASLQFKLFGRFWVSLDAPRHVRLIPLPMLATCAAENGLELVFASASDAEALAYSKWCWEASFNHLMTRSGLMPELGIRALRRSKGGAKKVLDVGRRIAFKSIGIGMARILNLVLAPLERSGYRGASYSAVFKKPALAQNGSPLNGDVLNVCP